MFRARANLYRFSKQLKKTETKTESFCSKSDAPIIKNDNENKVVKNLSSYDEAYKQLDKLDFMTASKILFTDPPKKKKFGIDFHLVQLFFVCMPSLAVYLVAQYARYEMRKMEADLELKRKKEEEKAKQMELEDTEDKNPELREVNLRLDKLEEAVKEIAVESKKQPWSGATKYSEKGQLDKAKHGADIDPSNMGNMSESSKSVEDHLGTQKIDQVPVLPMGTASESKAAPVAVTSREGGEDQHHNGGSSLDAKR